MIMNSLKLSTDLSNSIDDVIKCYICLGTITDTCMCPHCQKLTCQKCIQKWLLERKNQCPHCRTSLRLTQVVKLPFMNVVSTYVDHNYSKVKKESNEKCNVHSIDFMYYCNDCKVSLCSDCIIMEGIHKDHSIQKLKMIYETHRNIIKKEEEQLNIQQAGLAKNAKEIKEKITEVLNYKFKKNQELSETFESIKNHLDNNINDILNKLKMQLSDINDKLTNIENGKKEIERKINESSHSELIKKSYDIITYTKGIISKGVGSENIKENLHLNLSTEIHNDFIPNYESSTFVVERFSKLIRAKETEPIYSQGIKMNGRKWRLKVYVCGNAAANFDYLSVFIELIENHDLIYETCKYFYKIELVNYESTKRNFSQEHSSDFSQGDCWGYSKFFKLEKLDRDGYIDKQNDRITINFSVRPETYAQLSRDLLSYIKKIEGNPEEKYKPKPLSEPQSTQVGTVSNNIEQKKTTNEHHNNKENKKKKNDFFLLNDQSLVIEESLSKSLNMSFRKRTKYGKELFNFNEINDHNNQTHHPHPSEIKDKEIRKKDKEDKKDMVNDKEKEKINEGNKKEAKPQVNHNEYRYLHTMNSEPVSTNMNSKLDKINISPIGERNKKKNDSDGKSIDQVSNLKKFQIDLSLDSDNNDDMRDLGLFLQKNPKSDSFDEDSYGILMESLKIKEDKDANGIKSNSKRNLPSYKRSEEKNGNYNSNNNIFSMNYNPSIVYPLSLNNYSNQKPTDYNPFNIEGSASKNSRYKCNNDLFTNIFQKK